MKTHNTAVLGGLIMGTEGQVIHAGVDISIDPKGAAAFVSFTRPENGGQDITYERVMSALAERYVSFGIQDDEIMNAVRDRRYDENICAARWEAPVDGVDGTITYFFSTDQSLAPIEDEHGEVDFKNLGLVKNITEGTTIAKITLPTEGSPGKDVTGKAVPQRRGIAARYNVGKGTSLINDGTEIIAAVDGNLSYKNGAFTVEEVLYINGDVDVTSGNIDFIGDVNIKGSVFEGFSVVSKHNISISGSANGASLTANGSISVKIGCINCNIESLEGGDIKLGFCENCTVRTEGSVESVSFVGGEVYAGQKMLATGKGVIVGGKYTALKGMEASVIGSDTYTKTEIILGNNAVLLKERESLAKEIEQMEDKADQLGKILTTLAELAKKTKLPPEREQMKSDALRTRLRLQSDIKKYNKRIEEISKELEKTQNLSIGAKRMFYPGVTLRINSSILQINAVQSNSRATVVGGEIVFRPF